MMDSTTDPRHAIESPANMVEVRGEYVPGAPTGLIDDIVDRDNLAGLALKHAYAVQYFTTGWMKDRLHLPPTVVTELLEALRVEKLIEILGEVETFNYRFAITDRGRDRALRLLEISGYTGPAPVSLEEYTAILDWQFDRLPETAPERTESALSELVLSEDTRQTIAVAIKSGRTLFLYGPPGNGKTSVGRMLHSALLGSLWIPYSIAVENSVIRLYDPQCHTLAPQDLSHEDERRIDRRWVRIERPFVVVGGELTIEALDLGYNPAQNVYEAPLHLKANGGIFLLDDLGRQRVDADSLLNRWVIPLERQVDYLTLKSGQKVQVPLRQILVISTSLDPDTVIDPAFMRRIGYRLYLGEPSPERYGEIFRRYAARHDAPMAPGLVERLLERYAAEGRTLRCCEPRDLIERVRDICRYRNEPTSLDDNTLDLAWNGYFGSPK